MNDELRRKLDQYFGTSNLEELGQKIGVTQRNSDEAIADDIYEHYGCDTAEGKSIWNTAWEIQSDADDEECYNEERDPDAPQFYVFSSILGLLADEEIELSESIRSLLYEKIDAGLT